MKRLNPTTGEVFKHGDRRADGYRFYRYDMRRTKRDGTFIELWLKPENFEKNKRSNWSHPSAVAAAKRIKQDRRQALDQIKLERGCARCGYREHPAALDFDHIDPGQKAFTISRCLTKSWDSLMDEVRKCEVLCANCHRIRTFDEKHYNA